MIRYRMTHYTIGDTGCEMMDEAACNRLCVPAQRSHACITRTSKLVIGLIA